jgi:hypothetical protein
MPHPTRQLHRAHLLAALDRPLPVIDAQTARGIVGGSKMLALAPRRVIDARQIRIAARLSRKVAR